MYLKKRIEDHATVIAIQSNAHHLGVGENLNWDNLLIILYINEELNDKPVETRTLSC
jgi:hypothetical protein